MGVITPSGNTVVERVTMAILENFPDITPLFSRTPVFGETDLFPKSYDLDGMLAAAQLLAHANPEVLVWNGSKGVKIGVSRDHDFCRLVRRETGIDCSTSIIAMDEVLKARNIKRVALISPYDEHYVDGLVAGLEAEGYDTIDTCFSSLKDNISFAAVRGETISEMLRKVAAKKPEAILAICTNLPAAPVVARMEAELGIPIYDSTSIGVWKGLKMMDVDAKPAAAWGSLFAQ